MLLLAALLALAPVVRPDSVLANGPFDPNRPDSARWHASGELGFTDVSGNQSLSLLTTRFEVKRMGGKHAADLSLKGGVHYGRSNGAVAAEDYSLGGEVRLRPWDWISPFITATGLRDDVRHVNIRAALSAGADLNLIRDSVRRVSLGVALLQDYEALDLPDTSTAASSTSLTRFNVRFNASLPLRTGVTLEHTSTFQPVADHPSDYLFNTESAIRVILSHHLAFRTSWEFNRDTSPAEGVLFKNDRTLTVGLIFQTE